MPVQISLFTTLRDWPGWDLDPTVTITEVFERDTDFRSGRATLLTGTDGTIRAVARGGRRGSAGTFDSNVTFERITKIRPVAAATLDAAVNPRSRSAARTVFESGFGLFSESASADIRTWFAENDSSASSALENVLADEPGWMTAFPEPAATYRLERDAVNLALEIASLDREQALADEPPPRDAEHFLREGPTAVNEDSIIIDDLEVFPGWDRVRTLRPAGRLYDEPASGRRLIVLHANKNSIEHTTGVDLVYYVVEYSSFVLVQYKRIVREGNELVMRPDDQLDAELVRMSALETAYRTPSVPSELRAHRLSDVCCFLKLCDAAQPGEDTDLSRGKYVDLTTWNLMGSAGLMAGPQGGRRLRYNAITRYFNNSTFAEMVSEGWIGSAPSTFESLTDYVFERYESGRAVIMGHLSLGESYRRIPRRGQRIVRQVLRRA